MHPAKNYKRSKTSTQRTEAFEPTSTRNHDILTKRMLTSAHSTIIIRLLGMCTCACSSNANVVR